MKRPESKPRFFVYREKDGVLRCKCIDFWMVDVEKVVAWTDTFWDGRELAAKMNSEEAAARDPQRRLI